MCPLFTSVSLIGKRKDSSSVRERASTGSLLLSGIPNNWWCCPAHPMLSEGPPSVWGEKELLFVARSDMLGLRGFPLLGGETQDTFHCTVPLILGSQTRPHSSYHLSKSSLVVSWVISKIFGCAQQRGAGKTELHHFALIRSLWISF